MRSIFKHIYLPINFRSVFLLQTHFSIRNRFSPFEGKLVVFDDTCYFLPCQSEDDARLLIELLNSKGAKRFFRPLIFWDAKLPITAQLLSSLDLGALAAESGIKLTAVSAVQQELTIFRVCLTSTLSPANAISIAQ